MQLSIPLALVVIVAQLLSEGVAWRSSTTIARTSTSTSSISIKITSKTDKLSSIPLFYKAVDANEDQLKRRKKSSEVDDDEDQDENREDEAAAAGGTGNNNNNAKEELVTIPFLGLAGYERGRLFRKPVEVDDPAQMMQGLPGEPGSDEMAKAALSQISQRVEELKARGAWDESNVDAGGYGRSLPFVQRLFMMFKSLKPPESVSEVGLSYILIFVVMAVTSGFMFASDTLLRTGITWFLKTDFSS